MLWSSVSGTPSTATPTRGTSEGDLNQFNTAMRAQPWYQAFLAKHGLVDTGKGVTMTDAVQHDLENTMKAMGIQIPGGMHIDAGGNLNQRNHTLRNIGIGAAIGGGALLTAGALGAFGGAAAGGAGAGAGAGTAAGTIAPLTGATGATGVGALGAGAGGVYGGTTAAGLGSAVAGGAGAASAFPWAKVVQYAIPAVANVVQGFIGSNAAKNAAATQSAAADKAIGSVNQLTGEERARQESLYGGTRADLTNLYNTTAQTQNQIYNSTAANYLPYQQVGAGSLGSLAAMTGQAAPSGPGPSFTPIAAPQFSASKGTSGPNPTSSVAQNGPSAPAQPLPTETAPPPETQQAPQAPQQQAALRQASSYQGGSLGQLASQRVRLRAPTGEEMDFASSDPNLQRALSAGAQRVA